MHYVLFIRLRPNLPPTESTPPALANQNQTSGIPKYVTIATPKFLTKHSRLPWRKKKRIPLPTSSFAESPPL
eukprot:scaffold336877_cov24-Attheya_sp.AAC.1